jgi:hypothetical protein
VDRFLLFEPNKLKLIFSLKKMSFCYQNYYTINFYNFFPLAKCCVEKIVSLLSLQPHQFADVGLVFRVAEGGDIKKSFVGSWAVAQQFFIDVGTLRGHWPTFILCENFLSQDDHRFSGELSC